MTLTPSTLSTLSAALVMGGAAYGISKLASSAMDGMARQPEVADKIRTAMVIAAALIEGIAFFGIVVCLLALMK